MRAKTGVAKSFAKQAQNALIPKHIHSFCRTRFPTTKSKLKRVRILEVPAISTRGEAFKSFVLFCADRFANYQIGLALSNELSTLGTNMNIPKKKYWRQKRSKSAVLANRSAEVGCACNPLS